MATGCSPVLPIRSRRRRRGQLEAPDPSTYPAGETGTNKVEVRRDIEGYYGTWCEATIVDSSSAPAGFSFVTFDGHGRRQFAVAPTHVRPRPPVLESPPRFLPYDVVEAFHGGRWWSGGLVLSADPGSVTVAFPITRDVSTYMAHLVRPRRDFIDGHWVPARVAIAVRPSRAVRVYKVGDKVEVVRQRDAFGRAWFPARVRFVVDDLSYVVEYLGVEEGDAVEHTPGESEFQVELVRGTAVEAWCDGAWSPGLVRRVLGEGEYEIRIVREKLELLVTKVVSLLRPQYKWNGKQWRIATPPKKQANSRRLSVSGKSPMSPVEVSFSDEEHNLGKATLAEDSEHASVSEMNIFQGPMSALCKSPESTHSPNSVVSEKNSPQGSHGIVNSVCAFAGHSAPVDNQEILSDMVVTDGELNGPVSGRNVNGHDMLSIAELRKKKASGHRNQELQGKVSVGTKRGSIKKVVSRKKLANRRGSICSPNSSLDVTRTVQPSGRKEVAEPMEECPLASEYPKSGTQEQLNRTLEDAQNLTELSNQGLLQMVPHGFKSTDNGKCTNIHDTQFDEEPTGMTNSLIELKGNGDVGTDHTATKLAESNHVMETAILSLYCLAKQARRIVDERSVLQNAGSSQCIIDSSPLSCSASESLLPSSQLLSQGSSHQALFVKNSPLRPLVEATRASKELPEQQHFLSLQNFAPALHEGMELGMMVSFADLAKIIFEGSIDNSMEWFKDRIKTISHLEENVQYMKRAMSELVKLKSSHTSYHGEIGKLDLKFRRRQLCPPNLLHYFVKMIYLQLSSSKNLGTFARKARRLLRKRKK